MVTVINLNIIPQIIYFMFNHYIVLLVICLYSHGIYTIYYCLKFNFNIIKILLTLKEIKVLIFYQHRSLIIWLIDWIVKSETNETHCFKLKIILTNR